MNRSELVHELDRFVSAKRFEFKGDRELALYLMWFFTSQVKPQHDSTGIEAYLPKYLFEAMLLFRESDDELVIAHRELYMLATEMQGTFPDIISISYASSDRNSVIRELASLIERVTGDRMLRVRINSYFDAQETVLKQFLHMFVLKVYRQGLYELIRGADRDFVLQFGNTSMFVGVKTTIKFTLKKIDKSSMSSLVVSLSKNPVDGELTFGTYDYDVTGMELSLNWIRVPLNTAIEMIYDIVSGWPIDPVQQRLIVDSALRRRKRR